MKNESHATVKAKPNRPVQKHPYIYYRSFIYTPIQGRIFGFIYRFPPPRVYIRAWIKSEKLKRARDTAAIFGVSLSLSLSTLGRAPAR